MRTSRTRRAHSDAYGDAGLVGAYQRSDRLSKRRSLLEEMDRSVSAVVPIYTISRAYRLGC